MFELVEVARFDRKMGVGRTKPLLLVCDGPDGEVEVVAKFSEGCSVGGLVREAMTAMLALDLQLPVPAPYLVKLSPEFVDSIPDLAVADFLRKGDKFGFGSHRLPDGYAAWIPPAARMSAGLEQEALDIFALDCWLTNSDRRVSNPNLLTNGKEFAIFDHELALMTTLNMFWKQPWLVNALNNSRPPQDHIFFKHLRGRTGYSINKVQTQFQAITDQRIGEYVNALPLSWVSGTEVAIAKNFIIDLRDNLSPARTELTRALL